jgi:hypothetical protein
MSSLIAVLLCGWWGQAAAAPETPAPDAQIAAAVLAAPEDRRAGAAILGYDATGALVTLRQGRNDLVCLGDDPRDKEFSVACYHKDLEPFMARGRELRAQGVTGKEREERRWKEIDAGTLKMPREPRLLYVLSGTSFDAAAGKVVEPYLRWVVYTPYATPESTGLPTKASVPGGPWLMFPGTPGAHVMISPKKDAQ